MNRRSVIPRLIAVGILVLALAGCVRFQADLTVAPANTVDGTIIVAVINSDDTDESRAAARASADEVATGLLGDLKDAPGVSVSDYESDDDYVGYELRLSGVPFEAFSGTDTDSLHFAREGDEVVFTGALDFTDQSSDLDGGSEADDSNLTVSITFPGAVSEHNGELSGTTVRWSTVLEERVEMSARASAVGAGGLPILLFVGIGAAVLVALAIVVVLVVLRGRDKAPAATPVAPAATPAAAAVTPAVESPAAPPAAPETPAVESPEEPTA